MPDALAEPVMAETPTPVCQARTAKGICEAGPHLTKDGICARGHAMPGNQLRRTHGAFSFRDRGLAALPDPMRLSVDDFRESIVRDLGGPDELSTIMHGHIRRLGELETTCRLLASHLAQHGIFTPRGRVRSAYTQWLLTLDRWQKVAERIGIERTLKSVPSLSAYLAQAQAAAEDGSNG